MNKQKQVRTLHSESSGVRGEESDVGPKKMFTPKLGLLAYHSFHSGVLYSGSVLKRILRPNTEIVKKMIYVYPSICDNGSVTVLGQCGPGIRGLVRDSAYRQVYLVASAIIFATGTNRFQPWVKNEQSCELFSETEMADLIGRNLKLL